MPKVSDSVYVDVELDFDLADYESEIESEYCYGNCLRANGIKEALEEYVEDMYKNLYIYSESSKRIKTMKEIYEDLRKIIEED